MCDLQHSVVSNSATAWTVALQAPLSMGFSRQEYWGGLSFPSPGHLPDPGIEPGFPAVQADSLLSELPGKPLFCSIGSFNFPLHVVLTSLAKQLSKALGHSWSELLFRISPKASWG